MPVAIRFQSASVIVLREMTGAVRATRINSEINKEFRLSGRA